MTAGPKTRSIPWLLATGLGSGAFPKGPGTAGSILAVGIIIALDQVPGFAWWTPALLAAGASIICVALGPWILRNFGRQDPGAVVIDEFAGQWLALCIPVRTEEPWLVYGAAFVFFRVFDILKPTPVKQLERAGGGWGVLLDDIAAGAMALGAAWGVIALV